MRVKECTVEVWSIYQTPGDVASYYFWSCIPFLWILCSFMMSTDYCTGFSFYFILLYNSHNIDPNHSVKALMTRVIMNYIFNMFHKLHRYIAYYDVLYLICGTGTKKGVKATLNFIIVLFDFSSVVLETAEWLVCHLLCRTRVILVRFEYKRKPIMTTVSGSKSCAFMLTSALHVGAASSACSCLHLLAFHAGVILFQMELIKAPSWVQNNLTEITGYQ